MENTRDEKREQRAVEYLMSQLDENNPKAMLAIYKQIIEKKVFHTRVGYDFLDDLRSRLMSSEEIDNASIPDFAREEEIPSQIPVSGGTVKPARDSTPAPKPSQKPKAQSPGQSAPKSKKKSKTKAKEKAKPASEPKFNKPKAPTSKKGPFPVFVFSVFLNIVLLVMVIIMFILTITSDSPNIINYRNELEDEYSVWDEDLKRREKELKKKEAEFIERQQALTQQEQQGTEAVQDTGQDISQETEAVQDMGQDISQGTDGYQDTDQETQVYQTVEDEYPAQPQEAMTEENTL